MVKVHGAGNAVVLVLLSTSFAMRLGEVEAAVLPYGLLMTAAGVIILFHAGWLSEELPYKHMFGVNPHQMSEHSPALGGEGCS